jgi:hypothetical protein
MLPVNCKDNFAHRLRHQQVIADAGDVKSKNNIVLLRNSDFLEFFSSKMHLLIKAFLLEWARLLSSSRWI